MASRAGRARAVGAKACRAASVVAQNALPNTGAANPKVAHRNINDQLVYRERLENAVEVPEHMRALVAEAFAVLSSSKTNWGKRMCPARIRNLIDTCSWILIDACACIEHIT